MAKIKETAKPKTQPKKQPQKPVSPALQTEPKEPFCSFCSYPANELNVLIAGPNDSYICENCIVICAATLLEEKEESWRPRLIDLFSNPGKYRKPFN